MEKLTGHGRPNPRFAGEVGQHYEDIDTGDLYECRIAQEYSPTHGWPVGGYVWERRAKGEDIREIYGSGGNSEAEAYIVDSEYGYPVNAELLEKLLTCLEAGGKRIPVVYVRIGNGTTSLATSYEIRTSSGRKSVRIRYNSSSITLCASTSDAEHFESKDMA